MSNQEKKCENCKKLETIEGQDFGCKAGEYPAAVIIDGEHTDYYFHCSGTCWEEK